MTTRIRKIGTPSCSNQALARKAGEVSRYFYCGASISVYRVERLHGGEIALNIVCGALLIAVFVSATYFFSSWSKHEFLHLFEHRWVWHEPLDNWNL